ncbi:MAG: creatininase family protein [Bacteroidales bacterium]
MKNLLFLITLLIACSCKDEQKVLYEELSPAEFRTRLQECPVAYLPLGTLEWHGDHLPLGSDGIQSEEFFKILAAEAGGIVMPKLFLGPDFDTLFNGKEYYGMDCGKLFGDKCKYEFQQLAGSAYWVSDSVFSVIMESIMKQLGRAGFKIVVAHGHGPSTNFVGAHAGEYLRKYNLRVMNCWGNDTSDYCLMCDHAGANETSIMMALRQDLVKTGNLPADTATWPLGVIGDDPRTKASRDFGNRILGYEIKKMSGRIHEILSGM